MSDYGVFEASSTDGYEEEQNRRKATADLGRAIEAAREGFGDFLGAAEDKQDYKDRLALVMNDLMQKVADSGVMPVPGVMRKVKAALRPNFKQADAIDYYKQWCEETGRDWGDPSNVDLYGEEKGLPGYVLHDISDQVMEGADEVPDYGKDASRKQARSEYMQELKGWHPVEYAAFMEYLGPSTSYDEADLEALHKQWAATQDPFDEGDDGMTASRKTARTEEEIRKVRDDLDKELSDALDEGGQKEKVQELRQKLRDINDELSESMKAKASRKQAGFTGGGEEVDLSDPSSLSDEDLIYWASSAGGSYISDSESDAIHAEVKARGLEQHVRDVQNYKVDWTPPDKYNYFGNRKALRKQANDYEAIADRAADDFERDTGNDPYTDPSFITQYLPAWASANAQDIAFDPALYEKLEMEANMLGYGYTVESTRKQAAELGDISDKELLEIFNTATDNENFDVMMTALRELQSRGLGDQAVNRGASRKQAADYTNYSYDQLVDARDIIRQEYADWKIDQSEYKSSLAEIEAEAERRGLTLASRKEAGLIPYTTEREGYWSYADFNAQVDYWIKEEGGRFQWSVSHTGDVASGSASSLEEAEGGIFDFIIRKNQGGADQAIDSLFASRKHADLKSNVEEFLGWMAGHGYTLPRDAGYPGDNNTFDDELWEYVRTYGGDENAMRQFLINNWDFYAYGVEASRKQASDFNTDDQEVLRFFYQFEDEGLDASASGDEQWEWLKSNIDYDTLQDAIDQAHEYGEMSASQADSMAYDLQQNFFGSRKVALNWNSVQEKVEQSGWDPMYADYIAWALDNGKNVEDTYSFVDYSDLLGLDAEDEQLLKKFIQNTAPRLYGSRQRSSSRKQAESYQLGGGWSARVVYDNDDGGEYAEAILTGPGGVKETIYPGDGRRFEPGEVQEEARLIIEEYGGSAYQDTYQYNSRRSAARKEDLREGQRVSVNGKNGRIDEIRGDRITVAFPGEGIDFFRADQINTILASRKGERKQALDIDGSWEEDLPGIGYAKCTPKAGGGFELYMWSDTMQNEALEVVSSPEEARRVWQEWRRSDIGPASNVFNTDDNYFL